MAEGDFMRFAGFIAAVVLFGVSVPIYANNIAQQGYSKDYGQCMNLTYGQSNKAVKCIQKELKFHQKQLKKNLKAYKKANPSSAQSIQVQHQFWQQQVKQQCQLSVKSLQGHLQQQQCNLNMVLSQANLYASRLLHSKTAS